MEKNGKGELYDDDDKLKYEGEFMNGKKNGKGAEYERYPDIKYEGEFLNGKKNGKIKEYAAKGYFYNIYDTENPNLIFEGEYLNNYRIKGKTIINIVNYFLKENIYFQKNGMEKYMIIMEMFYMN